MPVPVDLGEQVGGLGDVRSRPVHLSLRPVRHLAMLHTVVGSCTERTQGAAREETQVSSRRKRPHGDPRKAGGSIAGPGGPFDRNAVVIDMENAVLLESTSVSIVEPWRDGQRNRPLVAMQLGGRINKTEDHSEVLYLFDDDGVAALVTELIDLAARAQSFLPEFLPRLMERLDAMPVKPHA
jgi:hypothetical protein